MERIILKGTLIYHSVSEDISTRKQILFIINIFDMGSSYE